jgi:hypothetical protein
MSDRPTISTLPAGGRYSVATLNSNFQALRDEFDNILGTNGTAGDNNTMSGNLNMGGNNITNAGSVLDTSGNDLSLEAGYAAEWANKAEDSLVSSLAGGDQSNDYSALHQATKAAASKTAAASSATASASSATTASTQATNAATSASTATTKAAAAATSATASASSATAAASSATAAASSATGAATSETNATSVISSIGLNYNFDTSTTMADPGTGDFRLNHATVASVTAISLDATTNDTGNPDLSDFIATWDDSTSTIGGYIVGKKVGTPATFFVYSVSTVADNTGWLQLTVAHVASSGSWSSGNDCILQFSRSGDKGSTGDHAGVLMAWESTTTDTDQGAGKVWLNNGTASSANILYMDDVEAGGTSINSYVDSWDDITNATARGRILVSKNSAPENFHIYNVTGSVSSASTYSKVTVTHVVSGGTISDADAVSVHFAFSGQDGSGDLTAANNLSDVSNAATSLNNIGGVGIGIVLALG